jgi:hypothetical protein
MLDGNSFINIFGTKTLLNNKDIYYDSDPDHTCGALVLLSSDPWLIDDSYNIQKRSDFLCEILISKVLIPYMFVNYWIIGRQCWLVKC